MDHTTLDVTGAIYAEIARGLCQAHNDHYAEAAAHFVAARERASGVPPPLVAALDAFIDSHTRYWRAQQALHEASCHFATASANQQDCLAALTRLSSSLCPAPDAAEEREPDARSTSADADYLLHRDHHDESPRTAPAVPSADGLPPLQVTLFGRFEVWRAGGRIELCSNRNGQAILRYLVAHPRRRETIDILVDALWSEDDADTGRHKLHVAASALRRSLNQAYPCVKGGGYLLCQDGVYLLNPEIGIATDVDHFQDCYEAGQRVGGDAAIAHYEEACRLYTGPFLAEDLYADWSLVQRERLTQTYLAMCDTLAGHYTAMGRYAEAIGWITTILAENRCDEAAWRGLMRAYAASGRRGEALRQYQRCERVLAEELGVQPMPETTALFHDIVQGRC